MTLWGQYLKKTNMLEAVPKIVGTKNSNLG
jgi:hypothetical protein